MTDSDRIHVGKITTDALTGTARLLFIYISFSVMIKMIRAVTSDIKCNKKFQLNLINIVDAHTNYFAQARLREEERRVIRCGIYLVCGK